MKSANDDVRTAVEEAVRPEREELASYRATLAEVRQMIADNQRGLDELQQMVNGSIQKSATDVRGEVVDLVEKTARLAQWVGYGSGQEAARPSIGSGVEAARIFWGIADE